MTISGAVRINEYVDIKHAESEKGEKKVITKHKNTSHTYCTTVIRAQGRKYIPNTFLRDNTTQHMNLVVKKWVRKFFFFFFFFERENICLWYPGDGHEHLNRDMAFPYG